MSLEFEAGFFCELLRDGGLAPRRVLVLGCGDGIEANHIARATGAPVTGVELVVDARVRLERFFDRVHAVSRQYYEDKFPRLGRYWPAVERFGLARFIAPSVYFRTGGQP